MTSPLDSLAGAGKPLRAEATDAKEFAGLLRSGLAKLKDAENKDHSIEGRFDLAYNAARVLCLAALRWLGYQPANRYIVFQALPHTLGCGPEVSRVLAKGFEIRNLGEYEGDLNIDERLLKDIVAAYRAVVQKVTDLPSLASP